MIYVCKCSLYFYLNLKMHVYCVLLIIMFLPKCVKYALLFLLHTVALVKRNSFHLSSSYCHCELRLRGPYY